VDHVIEVGGVGTLEQSIRSTRMGGHISLVGVLAGPQAPVNLTLVLMQDIRIQGVFVGPRESLRGR
jgi:threonine dehydrogenase-like Zn-dependent dehydrogenase